LALDRASLGSEDQKRRLESVLRVRTVAQNAAADAQDHRAVPVQQGCKRRFVAVREESSQESAIAVLRERCGPAPFANILQQRAELSLCHGPRTPGDLRYLLVCGYDQASTRIWK